MEREILVTKIFALSGIASPLRRYGTTSWIFELTKKQKCNRHCRFCRRPCRRRRHRRDFSISFWPDVRSFVRTSVKIPDHSANLFSVATIINQRTTKQSNERMNE